MPSFLGGSSKALTRGWGDGSGLGVYTHSVLRWLRSFLDDMVMVAVDDIVVLCESRSRLL